MNNPLPKPSFITEGFFYIPTFPVFLSKIIFEYDFEIWFLDFEKILY